MAKNLEVIRTSYVAWSSGDLDAWLEGFHPNAELQTSGVWPDFDPVYRGTEGLAEFWHRMHEAWEVFRVDIEQISEEGDGFAAAVRFRAKGVDSGIEVDMRFAHAYQMRDGLIAVLFSRSTLEQAREMLR